MEDERLTPEEYLQKLEAEMSRDTVPAPEPEAAPPETTEQQPPKKKKKKRKKKHYFLRFLIFCAVIGGIFYALQSSLFYVRDIYVEGNRFYTPAQIIEMSGLQTGKNMFFEINLKSARDELLKTPYIRVAELSRKPMSTLNIKLEERLEYAAVPDGDAYVLIDNEGMVLSISDKQPTVPLLEGMSVEDMQPGVPLKVEQAYLLADTLSLLKAAEETDLYFPRIYFSSVIVKAYINDSYYVEGHPEEIRENLEKIRTAMQEQYATGVNKGVIRVGSDGYLAFDPKIN